MLYLTVLLLFVCIHAEEAFFIDRHSTKIKHIYFCSCIIDMFVYHTIQYTCCVCPYGVRGFVQYFLISHSRETEDK